MNEKKRKVAFHTLGCKVNIYETQAMMDDMQRAGYEITDFEEKADVYIVNTCSVTNIADRKSRQMLRKARKENPKSVIVAAGCYVQAKAQELIASNDVDIIVGNNLKKDMAKIVNEYMQNDDVPDKETVLQSFLLDIHKEKTFEEFAGVANADYTRAFIKIQDGCNQFCTYCIIPFTRGRVRSRRQGDILNEIRNMVEKGYKEIVLTGIHISSYGVDFKSREDFEQGLVYEKNENYASELDIQHPNFGLDYDEKASLLADLIELIAKVDGVKRIRLGSLEPKVVSDSFLSRMQKIAAFCPHFHLSLQSGCDAILKKMNRKYTAKDYRFAVERIRAYFPNAALTTDVIVGFPGESEENFKESLQFVKEMQFAELHVFPYSKRDGTRAASFTESLTKSQKQERAGAMMQLGEQMRQAYMQRFLGEKVIVLLEKTMMEHDGKQYHLGHTKEYVNIAVPADVGRANDIVEGIVKKIEGMDMLVLEKK